MANTSILGIIIYKFSYWQEFGLVILFKINKNLRIRFYHTILTIILAINLKIKDNRETVFNFQKITK